MKVFVIEHPNATWCDDYSMVVVAEDELHAERRARLSSSDYREATDLIIREVDLTREQKVLTANMGS